MKSFKMELKYALSRIFLEKMRGYNINIVKTRQRSCFYYIFCVLFLGGEGVP